MLKIGDKAPYFEGVNQDGITITSNDFLNRKLVLCC